MEKIQIAYLGETQFSFGANNACPTIAVYWSLYLLYSTRPKLESLQQYLRLGSEDWCEGLRRGLHPGCFEHVTQPYARHPFVQKSMRIDDDLERHGLSLASEELYAQVPAQFRALKTVEGLRPAFEDIERAVRAPNSGGVRAFVFSRGGATMGGACRLLSNGAIRFDLVDSHERIISFAPPHHQSSAVWAQCYSVDDALRVMHDLFKPATSVADLLDVKEDDYIEQKRPRSMFSITVFKKVFATAEEAQQFYERKLDEWYYNAAAPTKREEVFA